MIAPLKFLKAAASEYATATKQNRRLAHADMPLLFEMLSHTKSFRWKSAFFEKGQGVAVDRVDEIVDLVFYNSKARKEVKRGIDRLGGANRGLFWDLYLRRVCNTVLGFSEEHMAFLKLASSALPRTGQITDWNSGTGNLAAALQLAVPERKVMAIDSNPRAVIATKRMHKHFFPETEVDFAAKVGSPLDPELSIRVSDGAVVHNGLFLLESDAGKAEFLKEVGANLLPGGVLVLVEPKPWLQKQSVLRLWLTRMIRSAVEAHSPVSEFEIALFVEVQRRLFVEAPNYFLDTKQWIAVAKHAGFEVNLVRDAFYGHYTALILRKVEAPKVQKKGPVIRYHDDPWPTGE